MDSMKSFRIWKGGRRLVLAERAREGGRETASR